MNSGDRPIQAPIREARSALIADVMRAAVGDLTGSDFLLWIPDHAASWPDEERLALALSSIEELLKKGWVKAGSYSQDPKYREEQDRWERENDFRPPPGAPQTAVWVAWEGNPADAYERIVRQWPTDSADVYDLGWELRLTPLGKRAQAALEAAR